MVSPRKNAPLTAVAGGTATPKRMPDPLHQEMLADLARSGLDQHDALALGLTPLSGPPAGVTPVAKGYKIPYFTTSGKQTGFFRFRFLADMRTGFEKLSGAKARRYAQPSGTHPAVYFPPYIDWKLYLEGAGPLILTEGEKKAARVTKGGFPTIGLGGVWSFQNAGQNQSLLPEMLEINWKDRPVYVIYDSDAADKVQIQQAEARLAQKLLELGAVVHVVRLPKGSDDGKVGLDDYVERAGIEALQVLCGQADPFNDAIALHEMNEEVCYIKDPGLIYVLKTGQLVSPGDFTAHRFADRRYTRVVMGAKGQYMEERSTASDWIKWPNRLAAERMVFEPGKPDVTEGGELNLWKGWKYPPIKGDVQPWHDLMRHLFHGSPENRKWAEQWLAYPIQNPGAKVRSGCVLWGRETGTGKSLVGYTMGDLYGKGDRRFNNFAEIGDKHLEKSDFNSWARNVSFCLADDITGSSSRGLANLLKTMLTREEIEINLKYVQAYYTRDCINYLFTSNSPDVFLLDEKDRRFFIHEVLKEPLPDGFYDAYNKWRYTAAARNGLMHYFMFEVDCSDFSPTSRPPMTSAKRDMIAITRTDLEGWLIGVRDDPGFICNKFGGSDLVTPQDLHTLYDPQNQHRVTAATFARKLKEVGIQRVDPIDVGTGQIRLAPNGELHRLYALRNYKRWATATGAALKQHYESCRKITMKKDAKF